MLTAGNNEYTYVDKNRYFNTGSNDFAVKSNQSIKWSTSGTVSGSITTNDTTCIGKSKCYNQLICYNYCNYCWRTKIRSVLCSRSKLRY